MLPKSREKPSPAASWGALASSRRWILAAWACAWAQACGAAHPPPPTPEATIVAFASAISQSEFKRAYRLMSSSYRERVSFEEFKRQLAENPHETIEIANALSRVRGPATQEAILEYREDRTLRLRRHGDRWYITTNIVDFYDQSTPRAALRAFIRAMERQRYDVVMRLVPESDKEGITAERMEEAWSGEGREEVERLLSNLKNHIDNPIEVIGNHATMPYGDNMRVQFVREGKVWKIEDPE